MKPIRPPSTRSVLRCASRRASNPTRIFWFLNLDKDAPSLIDYLGQATDYIDLIVDQSPSGQMEVIAGTQEYDVQANWKLMVENSVDDYHLPSTHSTWLNTCRIPASRWNRRRKPRSSCTTKGRAIDLGNGHFTTDNVNFRGRPVRGVDSHLWRRRQA